MSIAVDNVCFPSEGFTLRGRLYRPRSRRRFPAVALCHGYPGDTKNMDLAEELALNGIVTLVFYYQGAWGSEGTFRFVKLEPSTRDAVAYLRGLKWVNPDRVGIVSHSMGAVPLTKRMSLDSTLRTCVLMAPAVDLATSLKDDRLSKRVLGMLEMAKGKLSGLTAESLTEDLQKAYRTMNPISLVSKVKAPIMIVVGTSDYLTPPESCKRYFDAANEPKQLVLLEGADHIFSDHRMLLIRTVLDWLKETL